MDGNIIKSNLTSSRSYDRSQQVSELVGGVNQGKGDEFGSENPLAKTYTPTNTKTGTTAELLPWIKAYREAEGDITGNRVLDPSIGDRWKKVSDATKLAVAKHPEQIAALKQHPFEDLVRETYNICRSESNILNSGWVSRSLYRLTGQGYNGPEEDRRQHIAVLRESIDGAIKQLGKIKPSEQVGGLSKSTIQSYIESYKDLLKNLPETLIKVTPEQRKRYWESLTQRHPMKAPESWFSDSTASALGVLARTAMLTGPHLPPSVRSERRAATGVNAESEQGSVIRVDSPNINWRSTEMAAPGKAQQEVSDSRVARSKRELDEAVAVASNEIQDPQKIAAALAVFRARVFDRYYNGEWSKEILAVASKGMQNPQTAGEAIEIFDELLHEHGVGFEEAIDAASKGMQNPQTAPMAIELFGLVFSRTKEFDEKVRKAASEASKSGGELKPYGEELMRLLRQERTPPVPTTIRTR